MNTAGSSARIHLFILGCIAAVTALLLLAPASWLAFGPGCVFHCLLHLNCPFCGMTRDFTAILHGRQPQLNPFSWPAIVAVYLVYPALFLWAWSTQRLAVFHRPAVHTGLAVVLLVMLVANNLPR